MYALLWLLLPLAALSGWWAARLSQRRGDAAQARFKSAYGQGLNYLLNEEPDRALEVLVQLVEVDRDSLELHLALGSLFRRRGEVDRAIRVHQNMLARNTLEPPLREQVMLELARDFLKAGLLDRAEHLLLELRQAGVCLQAVCRHLADLYQQEKEWRDAIDAARCIAASDPAHWHTRIAHYCCELGDDALRSGRYEEALAHAREALAVAPDCVRGSCLLGSVYQCRGEFVQAIEAYRAIERQNRGLFPEVSAALRSCYVHLGHEEAAALQPASADQVGAAGYPDSGRYKCVDCGFSSRKLFWQCPGCQRWSSVKPVSVSEVE